MSAPLVDASFLAAAAAATASMTKPWREMTPGEARAAFRAGMSPSRTVLEAVVDRTVATAAGDVALRAYRPTAADDLPLVLYMHGGGWVVGDLDTHDDICRRLAVGAECVVVSVDYRLAPEHPFPAALDDVCAAFHWLDEHAAELGGDRSRIAIAGDSAGGNLATTACLRLRDEGGPMPAFQLLVYPVVTFDEETMQARDGIGSITREDACWFYDQYLPRSIDRTHPYVAPLGADLAGSPPALVIAAACDALCAADERYAKSLREAGVPTTFACVGGVGHGFFSMGGALSQADEALQLAATSLREALSSSVHSTKGPHA